MTNGQEIPMIFRSSHQFLHSFNLHRQECQWTAFALYECRAFMGVRQELDGSRICVTLVSGSCELEVDVFCFRLNLT